MKPINLKEVSQYVKDNIGIFHANRLTALATVNLKELLKRKNPYLFRAKNLVTAHELVTSFLDAALSSSEEEIFGNFLEDLAIFVAQKTLNATKSSSSGIDFEYAKDGVRYLVCVKSGANWGNSSQWNALVSDVSTAIKVLRQSSHVKNVHPILGICYGKQKTTVKKGLILQVTGQNFWYMISGNELFYTEIVEPLGEKAKERNDLFNEKKAELINKLTKEFVQDFCDKEGRILWDSLVQFNSGNITDKDRKNLV